MKKFIATTVALVLLATASAWAGSGAEKAGGLPPETPGQRDARMAWWREARFGLFMHWGIYAVPAGEWKGFEGVDLGGEWIMYTAKIPVPQYEQLAKHFNPVKFSAQEWVQLAKDTGMKYMVITAKHCDGFAMYRSKVTPYNIVDATPFARDPMRELDAECRRAGIPLGFYYSHAWDWHEPDALGLDNTWSFPDRSKKDADRYLRGKALPQVAELLTQYRPSVLWFDVPHELLYRQSEDFLRLIRKLYPACIINDRIGNGLGDYGTPESYIPAKPPQSDFEVCMPLNDHWGYDKTDPRWKPSPVIIRNLVDIVSKGGNYLLNVGPRADGTFPPEAVRILGEVGRWMKPNGESIYGTTAGPLQSLPWGRSTAKAGKVYLHVLDWPADGRLVVPGLKNKIASAYLLAGPRGGQLPVTRISEQDAMVQLPAKALDPVDTVVALDVEGPPDIEPTPLVLNWPGRNTIFDAGSAAIHGRKAQYLERSYSEPAHDRIVCWCEAGDWAAWDFRTTTAGAFDVDLTYGAAPACEGNEYTLTIGRQQLASPSGRGTMPTNADHASMVPGRCPTVPAGEGSQTFTAKVTATGAYRNFHTFHIGKVSIPAAGRYAISIKPKKIAAGSGLMDLRTVTLTAQEPVAEHPVLWYRQPAPRWIEALPVGNGRLGAMVFGAVGRERIQLNDDSLWAGRPLDRHNPEALKALPEVRRLLFAEKHEEAARLAQRTMLGVPCQIESYQPLGDLWLDVGHWLPSPSGRGTMPTSADHASMVPGWCPTVPGGEGQVSDYRRELDLDAGIARVSYTAGGTHFVREVFATAVDQVMALRFTCDRPGRITCGIRLTRSQEARTEAVGPDRLVLRGATNGGKGMKFEAHLRAIAPGGKLSAADQGLHVQGADSLVLLLASATTYRPDDPAAVCRRRLESAATKGFDALRADHVKDHQAMFRRVKLDLGDSADHSPLLPVACDSMGEGQGVGELKPSPSPSDLPTDQRLAAVRQGADDPQLAALYFQFGRYLLMACSRPGCLPANLQGIWNEDIAAPWNADFHANINLQMNYWPAEVCNLAECHLPLVDLMDRLVKPGEETARRHYGAGGWVVHHLTDAWGFTVPADGLVGLWPVGAAWLCQHPLEHYRFSGDKEFLACRAYPLMKGAARFILDFLVEAPPGTPVAGHLVTAPAHSPENAFLAADGKPAVLTYAPAMDLEIVHDLLSNCIEAIDILGPDGRFDAPFRAELVSALGRLAPLRISKRFGGVQEWVVDYDETEPQHRHISPVFGFYPGRQITLRGTPAMAEAIKQTLLRRGDANAAWSMAWKMNAWARLEDGDHAYALLKLILAGPTQSNLLDADPSLLVDANLGATAGIAEMLLQSHAGEISLLPALPRLWKSGHVEGLRARGGLEVAITWNNGRATEAILKSAGAGRHAIRVPRGQQIARIFGAEGGPIALKSGAQGTVLLETAPGATYRLEFAKRS